MTITRRRAFVVEVDRSAPLERGGLKGSVEHLDSGSRARFATSEEMLRFIAESLNPDAEQENAASN